MAAVLPTNWTRYTTEDGKEYFHNSVTNVTQWDRPQWPATGGPDSLSFSETSTSEVYRYTPSKSDLELTDRGSSLEGQMAPVMNQQALGGVDPVGKVPSGPVPTTERETVSLNDAPRGGMVGLGAGGLGGLTGAVGGVIAAASAEEGPGVSGMAGSLLTYAQQFFDVSTDDVVKRLRLALLPFPFQTDGTQNEFRMRPDFWGPFWVATTAVFFLAATGNFARLIESPDRKNFSSDYGLVSISAAMVYGCLLAVPLITRASLYFAGQEADSINFKQMICVYGYSLTPAIPVSVICVAPVGGIRTLAVFVGLGISLAFIRGNLWTDLSVEAPSLKWAMIGMFVVVQAGIFLTYRIHFFGVA